MTPEEAKLNIKVGDTYNVRVKVAEKEHDKIITRVVSADGTPLEPAFTTFFGNEVLAFSLVNQYPAPIEFFKTTVIPEAAPKYDPCREFREGDKVKAVIRHGRIPNDGVPKDTILTVVEDERDGIVKVLHKMGVILEIFNVYALYLELVAPVEELEPYYVGKAEINTTDGEYDTWAVFDEHGYIVAQFADEAYKPGEAKARAEQERDSRNAEHREEQSND